MKIIRTVRDMHSYADSVRSRGATIALVPTMGYLHEGHLSLMRLAKAKADTLVVSVFVNPRQFGPGEDFEDYPRDWGRDSELLVSVGTDCAFVPDVEQMYPEGYQTSVAVRDITKNLCGRTRPSHFEGVTTVVAKLFDCTKPHCAVFGQKDFQQLMVIRRMVTDLNMDIEIIGAPIVRESDGIAMSSRNTYLSPEQRAAARCLSQALFDARDLFSEGERRAEVLLDRVTSSIDAEPLAEIDYVQLCDVATLTDIDRIEKDAVLAAAVYFGQARLIDNVVLEVPA